MRTLVLIDPEQPGYDPHEVAKFMLTLATYSMGDKYPPLPSGLMVIAQRPDMQPFGIEVQ